MLLRILLIFIGVPLVEIYFFAKVGEEVGGLMTVLLVVFTALLGVFMIRLQGLGLLVRAQEQINSGKPPALELMEGLFLVIAGIFLLIPGFFTDTLGFLILFPPIRRFLIKAFIQSRIQKRQQAGSAYYRDKDGNRVFDGEFEEQQPKSLEPPKNEIDLNK